MALVEIEFEATRFGQLVQFIAITGPIPVGVINALGYSRLIAEFNWGLVTPGPGPAGFVPPPGTITARAAVTLRHVSTDELDANPNATGSTTPATAFLLVTASNTDLTLTLLAIDVDGAPRQTFVPPVYVARQPAPPIAQVRFAAAAVLMRDGIVTLRFATQASDPLLSTPLNLIDTSSNDWAIRLSGDLFAEQLVQRLQVLAQNPPDGSLIEEQPTASWGFRDGAWSAIGSLGLLKPDVCPGLLGIFDEVDLSVTVDVLLTPSATLPATPPPPPRLVLTLRLSSDASDWDTFRCWLGTGFAGSSLVGNVMTHIIGPGTGGLAFLAGSIVSLVAIAETVRLDAGRQIKEQTVEDFTQVSSSSTTATYTSQNNLPSILVTLSNGNLNGSIRSATTGSYGMLISGTVTILMPQHKASFDPAGGSLNAVLQNAYECGRNAWIYQAEVPIIKVEDQVTLLTANLLRAPVTIFPTSKATPGNLWSVELSPPDVTQLVMIRGTDAVQPSNTGRVYLHTSAGIRRYDIAPLPAPDAPSLQQTIAAVAQCERRSKMFTPREELEWLVDPPPYNFGRPALRQWLFTFAELPAGTQVVIHRLRAGERDENSIAFQVDRAGEAAFEIITEQDQELIFEHNQEAIENGRMSQRWIVPLDVVDIGEPGRKLTRAGSQVVVTHRSGIVTYDLSTGAVAHRRGNLRLERLSSGSFEIVEQRRLKLNSQFTVADDLTAPQRDEGREHPLPPFGITLPRRRVAVLHGTRLVIGVPSTSERVIRG